MDILGNRDAGFGTGSDAEIRNLLPHELERMQKLQETAQPAGAIAVSTAYELIGIEATAELTKEERRALAEQGISSHPVGFGVAYYRRINV